MREYFYGGRTPLYPHVFDINFADINIYKIGGKSYDIFAKVQILKDSLFFH